MIAIEKSFLQFRRGGGRPRQEALGSVISRGEGGNGRQEALLWFLWEGTMKAR